MTTSTLEQKPSEGDPAGFSIIDRCDECPYTAYTWSRVKLKGSIIKEHLAQHEPGRAVDIEVNWEPSAFCSVCEDGIGDIKTNDSESLRCDDCDTTWDIDGRNGETDDQ